MPSSIRFGSQDYFKFHYDLEDLDAKAKKTIKDVEKRYARITFRYGEKIQAMADYAEGKISEAQVTSIFTYMDLMNEHDFEMINKANTEFFTNLFGEVKNV